MLKASAQIHNSFVDKTKESNDTSAPVHLGHARNKDIKKLGLNYRWSNIAKGNRLEERGTRTSGSELGVWQPYGKNDDATRLVPARGHEATVLFDILTPTSHTALVFKPLSTVLLSRRSCSNFQVLGTYRGHDHVIKSYRIISKDSERLRLWIRPLLNKPPSILKGMPEWLARLARPKVVKAYQWL